MLSVITSLATVCQCRWLSHWSIRSWCRNLHLSGTSKASLTNSPTATLKLLITSTDHMHSNIGTNMLSNIHTYNLNCLPRHRYGTTMCVWLRHCLRPFLHQFWMLMGWLASTTFVIISSGYTWRNGTNIYVNLLSPSSTLSLHHFVLLRKYLLAVLQDALLGANAALGARRVRLPLATLHIDVHVKLPAEHGHLGLS